MKIRQEQLDAMQRAMPAQRMPELERALIEHLRIHFPAALHREDDASLLRRIRQGVAVARSHGLERRASWALLIDLMVVLGADFLERGDCGALSTTSAMTCGSTWRPRA
ncbi:MAG TPA: hypothetical protein VGR02_03020 [Thermoanaerobaculia bacterium]|jgi:hypothetical protein|nr:hypothetical protein [Thermoanaerobaculia bacterium]